MPHAFLWQNGVMTDLGVLPGGDDESWAAAINNLGQIVGHVGPHRSRDLRNDVAVVPLRERRHDRPARAQQESYAVDINDSGVVVGTMRAGGGISHWHAYIYADGVVTNLNSLIPAGSGLHLLYANGINNAGQIVGAAYDARASYHAFLLTPVAPGHARRQHRGRVGDRGPYGDAVRQFHRDAVPASSQPVTVSYSTANGTAAAGSDYQAASGTVTFDAGQTTKTIAVPGQRRPRRRAERDLHGQRWPGSGERGARRRPGRGHDRRRRAAGQHQLRDEERRQLRDDAVRLHGQPVACAQRTGQPELRHGERLREIR